MNAPVRVVLADDAAAFRQFLRLLLEADGRFDVVGEAGDGAAAVELCSAQQPDVVVLDLAMPVLDGLEAIPQLRERAPGTRIVVLSGFARGRLDAQVLASGASAYVEKSEAFEVLAETLLDTTAAHPAA